MRLFILLFGAFIFIQSLAAEASSSFETRHRLALYDYIVAQSALVQTSEDFHSVFLAGLPVADRQDLMTGISKARRIGRFRRRNDSLIYQDGMTELRLKWLYPKSNEFEVNGVHWVYDPSKRLMEQLAELDGHLRSRKKSSWEWSWLPQAEAQAVKALTKTMEVVGPFVKSKMEAVKPAFLILLGAGLSTVGQDVIWDSYCAGLDAFGRTKPKCQENKKAEQDAAYGEMPSVDAVKNQIGSLDKNKNILAQFEAQEWSCPSNADGNDRIYKGRLREVEILPNKTKRVGEWKYVIFKFNSDGDPLDLVITTTYSDDSNLDKVNNLFMHVPFDPTTGKAVKIRLANPEYDSKKFGMFAAKKILTLTPATKMSADQEDKFKTGKDIIKYLNYRNYNCVIENVEKDMKAGVEPAAPSANPKSATATQ